MVPTPAAVAEAPRGDAGGRRRAPRKPRTVPAATPVSAERERRVEVQAPDYTVAFTNRGARLVSWTLARHRDARGGPEEMIPAQGAAVRPLDVETGDPAVDARLRDALFAPSAETVAVAGAEEAPLRFACVGRGAWPPRRRSSSGRTASWR